ncbi:MAG: hypothetical protein ACOYU0_08045 [Nitrospirota bacterium]
MGYHYRRSSLSHYLIRKSTLSGELKIETCLPSTERKKIEREIAVTDENIDDIVFGLYEITEAEKKIIEG